MKMEQEKILVGWREWASLPGLGVPAIKMKVDTGARTSALHAFSIETFEEKGKERVRFAIHPLQKRRDIEISCVADIVDKRIVSDSGGHREKRIVIKTPIRIGDLTWDVEFTLTDRDTMRFRALLGRTAMESLFVVDPKKSFITGKSIEHEYLKYLTRKHK
ncbi:MAG: RimK/LysX family protein [bacterium]|nr:RimK/LysX family protein [bacterium]